MTAETRILYVGDSSLQTAAAYLGGILAHYDLAFDYVPGDQTIAAALAAQRSRSLYIISDYPVKNMTEADQQAILAAVRGGAGLLMIGGWGTFHGLDGLYQDSAIAEALPVTMADSDDRVNSWAPCVVEKAAEHPIIKGLPLETPPTIGGYNRIAPKTGSTVVLAARRLHVRRQGQGYSFSAGDAAPLLVVGSYGKGRTAAFASDVAPHWVGGLVDWGDSRVNAQAPGGGDPASPNDGYAAASVEVGNHYAEFFARLVKWTAGAM